MVVIIAAMIISAALFYYYKNEIEVRTVVSRIILRRGPKIGIVSSWARQGVPYQSRFLSQCLSAKHEVYIFAYKNIVKDEADWGYKELVYTKVIKPRKVIDWIKKNGLNALIFPDRLEDKEVLLWCKKNGVATIMEINYETIKKEEFSHYSLNTVLHCPVKCTQDLLKRFGFRNTKFIRWGIDEKLFSPAKRENSKYVRFFHNAGHGGAEWRKNTQAVVSAFDRVCRSADIQLVITSQKPLREYPEEVRRMIANNGHIKVIDRELEMGELIDIYRSCDISLLPSKWEGIGIPFLESLAMGLPVITVDAPPMNEWVKDGYNGLTAKVLRWEARKDKHLLVKAAIVDVADLARKMIDLTDAATLKRMKRNAVKSMKNSRKKFTVLHEKLIRSIC
jgi:1,2-diacylglycerol 3-alpha-glucosyltransferase